jgi:hypothetical protein
MRDYQGCLITRDAAQTIATTTVDVLLEFNEELHDTDGFHDNSVNPERIAIPTGFAGTYWVYASVQWESNATGVRFIIIRVNGTDRISHTHLTLTGGSLTQHTGAALVLAEDDYVDLNVYQASGGNLDIEEGDAPYTPLLGIHRLGYGSGIAIGALAQKDGGHQTIDDSTATQITFQTELWDREDFWVSGSGSQMTVPTDLGGYYHIIGVTEWQLNASGIRWLEIRVNGTAVARSTQPVDTASVQGQHVEVTKELSAGDIVTLWCYQDSGGGLAAHEYRTQLGVDFIGV